MPVKPGPDVGDKPRPQPRPAPRPSTKAKNLEPEIAQMLVISNLMAAPFLGNDTMDDAEIMVLARSMNEQAQKSPRFRKVVEGALTATGASGLIGVVVIITGRRLARHRVIEPSWDQKLGAMLRLQLMDLDPEDPEAMAAAAQMLAREMMETPSEPRPESTNGATPA